MSDYDEEPFELMEDVIDMPELNFASYQTTEKHVMYPRLVEKGFKNILFGFAPAQSGFLRICYCRDENNGYRNMVYFVRQEN